MFVLEEGKIAKSTNLA